MNTPAMFLTAAALSVFAGATLAAEDHSQHQQPAQQTDEHAGHNMPAADGPTESELAHIAPDPPQHVMGDMSNERMIELMQMEDDAEYSMVLLDQLEWQKLHGNDAFQFDSDLQYVLNMTTIQETRQYRLPVDGRR